MDEKTFRYTLVSVLILGFLGFVCLVGASVLGLTDRILQSKTGLAPEPSLTITETSTPPATWTPTSTLLPTSTPAPVATWTLIPTRTPTSETTTFLPGDKAGFTAYLRSQYSSIAGQKLGIADLLIYDKDDDRFVSIDLTRGSGLRVFEKQTRDVALDYGTRLLRDTVRYFNGQWCGAFVGTNFYSSDLSRYYGDDWCDVGDFSELENGWPISQYYVRVYYTGEERVEVWNK